MFGLVTVAGHSSFAWLSLAKAEVVAASEEAKPKMTRAAEIGDGAIRNSRLREQLIGH
jgi:hypothetical protein